MSADTLALLLLLLMEMLLLGLRPSRPAKNVGLMAGGWEGEAGALRSRFTKGTTGSSVCVQGSRAAATAGRTQRQTAHHT
jgi:hypothetical protein